MLRGEIASTDQAIDALVYKLYGLTEAEIKIVEAVKGRTTSVLLCFLPSQKKNLYWFNITRNRSRGRFLPSPHH
jgi:hypothetical protein